MNHPGDSPDLLDQFGKLLRLQALGAIGEGLFGMSVNLDQQAIGAGGDSSVGHGLDILPLAGSVAGI